MSYSDNQQNELIIELPVRLLKKIDQFAKDTGISREEFIDQALKEALSEFIQQIEK